MRRVRPNVAVGCSGGGFEIASISSASSHKHRTVEYCTVNTVACWMRATLTVHRAGLGSRRVPTPDFRKHSDWSVKSRQEELQCNKFCTTMVMFAAHGERKTKLMQRSGSSWVRRKTRVPQHTWHECLKKPNNAGRNSILYPIRTPLQQLRGEHVSSSTLNMIGFPTCAKLPSARVTKKCRVETSTCRGDDTVHPSRARKEALIQRRENVSTARGVHDLMAET